LDPDRFILPNYHVILVHYPMALFVLGVGLELLTLVVRSATGLRTAGRWMIGFGVFSMAPTAMSGIFALSQADINSEDQRHMLVDHAWQQSAASLLALLVVATWLACSDRWRRRLYVPALGALLCAVALSVTGAWHAGEAVYRYGTNVVAVASPDDVHDTAPSEDKPRGLSYFVDPLDGHLLLAGVSAAFTIFALAMAARRLVTVGQSTPPAEAGSADVGSTAVLLAVGAIVAGAATASFGWWYLYPFTAADLLEFPRRWLHVGNGGLLVGLAVVLALTSRSKSRPRPKLLAAVTLLFVASLSLQVWLGVLMLFEGPPGSVLKWETPD
jgi:uncharacterized membrane protein